MDLAVEEKERVSRRSFLGYTIAAVGAFFVATLGSATAIFAASPLLGQRSESKVSLGPASGFRQGVPKLVQFPVTRKDGWIVEDTQKAVWVVRESEANFAVLVAHCTHLGCAFNWNQSAQEFLCPCHNGRYSMDGQVLGGPPPRGLDRLENWVEGDKLVVNYREFRLGVPEQVEA